MSTPTLYVIGGRPGSGKTTLRQQLLAREVLPSDAFLHDPDAVMASMPGYRAMAQGGAEARRAAFAAYEVKALALAEHQLEQAASTRAHIIYERTLGHPRCLAFLRAQKACGYRIDLRVLHCSAAEALRRVAQRGAEIGRYTPAAAVKKRGEVLRRLWPAYLALADRAEVLHGEGEDFRPILSAVDHRTRIADAEAYRAFCTAREPGG